MKIIVQTLCLFIMIFAVSCLFAEEGDESVGVVITDTTSDSINYKYTYNETGVHVQEYDVGDGVHKVVVKYSNGVITLGEKIFDAQFIKDITKKYNTHQVSKVILIRHEAYPHLITETKVCAKDGEKPLYTEKVAYNTDLGVQFGLVKSVTPLDSANKVISKTVYTYEDGTRNLDTVTVDDVERLDKGYKSHKGIQVPASVKQTLAGKIESTITYGAYNDLFQLLDVTKETGSLKSSASMTVGDESVTVSSTDEFGNKNVIKSQLFGFDEVNTTTLNGSLTNYRENNPASRVQKSVNQEGKEATATDKKSSTSQSIPGLNVVTTTTYDDGTVKTVTGIDGKEGEVQHKGGSVVEVVESFTHDGKTLKTARNGYGEIESKTLITGEGNYVLETATYDGVYGRVTTSSRPAYGQESLVIYNEYDNQHRVKKITVPVGLTNETGGYAESAVHTINYNDGVTDPGSKGALSTYTIKTGSEIVMDSYEYNDGLFKGITHTEIGTPDSNNITGQSYNTEDWTLSAGYDGAGRTTSMILSFPGDIVSMESWDDGIVDELGLGSVSEYKTCTNDSLVLSFNYEGKKWSGTTVSATSSLPTIPSGFKEEFDDWFKPVSESVQRVVTMDPGARAIKKETANVFVESGDEAYVMTDDVSYGTDNNKAPNVLSYGGKARIQRTTDFHSGGNSTLGGMVYRSGRKVLYTEAPASASGTSEVTSAQRDNDAVQATSAQSKEIQTLISGKKGMLYKGSLDGSGLFLEQLQAQNPNGNTNTSTIRYYKGTFLPMSIGTTLLLYNRQGKAVTAYATTEGAKTLALRWNADGSRPLKMAIAISPETLQPEWKHLTKLNPSYKGWELLIANDYYGTPGGLEVVKRTVYNGDGIVKTECSRMESIITATWRGDVVYTREKQDLHRKYDRIKKEYTQRKHPMEYRRLTVTHKASSPALSPNGEKVVYLDNGKRRTLYCCDSNGDNKVRLSAGVFSPKWIDDQTIMFWRPTTRMITTMNVNTQAKTEKILPDIVPAYHYETRGVRPLSTTEQMDVHEINEILPLNGNISSDFLGDSGSLELRKYTMIAHGMVTFTNHENRGAVFLLGNTEDGDFHAKILTMIYKPSTELLKENPRHFLWRNLYYQPNANNADKYGMLYMTKNQTNGANAQELDIGIYETSATVDNNFTSSSIDKVDGYTKRYDPMTGQRGRRLSSYVRNREGSFAVVSSTLDRYEQFLYWKTNSGESYELGMGSGKDDGTGITNMSFFVPDNPSIGYNDEKKRLAFTASSFGGLGSSTGNGDIYIVSPVDYPVQRFPMANGTYLQVNGLGADRSTAQNLTIRSSNGEFIKNVDLDTGVERDFISVDDASSTQVRYDGYLALMYDQVMGIVPALTDMYSFASEQYPGIAGPAVFVSMVAVGSVHGTYTALKDGASQLIAPDQNLSPAQSSMMMIEGLGALAGVAGSPYALANIRKAGGRGGRAITRGAYRHIGKVCDNGGLAGIQAPRMRALGTWAFKDSDGNPLPTCFVAGTKVLMYDGSYKNIEDMEVGDYVLSWDEETGENVAGYVSATMQSQSDDLYEITFEDEEVAVESPQESRIITPAE